MSKSLRWLMVLVAIVPMGSAVRALSADKSAYQLGERLPQAKAADSKAGMREIKWDDLVPADWDPRKALAGLDFSNLDDSDPRAQRALEKLREVWNNAPANASMNGAQIRIPGFLVPLERKGKLITEFLLVPYYGACVHTPPPPANQIIHVLPGKPVQDVATMDAVWVNGVLEVSRSETGLGNASYRLKATRVEPYRDPGKRR